MPKVCLPPCQPFGRSRRAMQRALASEERNEDAGGASSMCRRRPCSPNVDAGEKEQPDHVDEMPVPGRRLEAEVLLRGELPGKCAHQADEQEDRTDDHVKAVKTGRHEERRSVDMAGIVEGSVAILEG